MTDPPLEPPLDDRPDEGHILPPEDVPPISAEDLVDGEHPPAQMEERRYPSTIGGAFYLVVLAITLAGLLVVTLGDWRVGIRMVGGALFLAAGVRTVLSAQDAGMLAVRHRALDAAVLIGLGAALVFLATSIPDQPGL